MIGFPRQYVMIQRVAFMAIKQVSWVGFDSWPDLTSLQIHLKVSVGFVSGS